ncbi:MAG: murein biosynthesis integral membrane protein MurJ [Opitutales bacterium]
MPSSERQYQDMAKTASWTMVSRVLGLVRDQMIAAVFGSGAAGAAFLFAFQIPNLFRRLLGEGALTAAIVPVLAQKRQDEGVQASHDFLNHVLRRVAPWMLLITLGVSGCALAVSFLIDDPRHAWAAELTACCMPYMPLICLAALFTAAVNLTGRFGLAEIASGLLNVCMIASLGLGGLLFAGSDIARARWLCAGALLGGLLQLLVPMWGLRKAGWRQGPGRADEKSWSVLRAAFIPAAFGAGVQQVNFLVSRFLAYDVSDSGLTYYYIANRIVELPIGLFSASVATVMFPALASAWAGRDDARLSADFARGFRLILAVNIGAAVGLAVLAEPIIRLLFEFGRFSAVDCANTRILLVLFAFTMPFYALMSLVTRALNVAGETRSTFHAAMQALAVNVALSLVSVLTGQGVEGLAVANGASTVWQYAVLRRSLKERAPQFLGPSFVSPLFKACTGSLVMGVVAYQGHHLLVGRMSEWLGGKGGLIASMTLAGAAAMAVYAFILDRWAYPERDMLRDFSSRIFSRFIRRA